MVAKQLREGNLMATFNIKILNMAWGEPMPGKHVYDLVHAAFILPIFTLQNSQSTPAMAVARGMG